MPQRELIHVNTNPLLLATAAGATTAQTSAWLDTLGFNAAAFNLHIGPTIGSAVAWSVQESDDGSASLGAAPATSVIDDSAVAVASKTVRVAYVGAHRYARVVVTPTGATDITISATLGLPSKAATANPA